MKNEEQIKDIFNRVLSKLKTDFNFEISTLIDTNEVWDRIAQLVNGNQEEECVFDTVYPLIYSSAWQNLTNNVFVDESCSFGNKFQTTENSENSCLTSKDNDPLQNVAIPLVSPLMKDELNPGPQAINALDVQLNDIDSDYGKMANVFCLLLPNLSKNEVELKLKNNSHNSGYKVTLLQESIRNAFDEGYDVSNLVFSKLEEWLKNSDSSEVENTKKKQVSQSDRYLAEVQNENSKCRHEIRLPVNDDDQSESEDCKEKSQSLNEKCKVVPNFSIEELQDKIAFISETVPGVSEENIKKVIHHPSMNEANAIISEYLKYFNSPYSYENQNGCCEKFDSEAGSSSKGKEDSCLGTFGTTAPSDAEEMKSTTYTEKNDKGCIIVNVKKGEPPPLISLDEEVSSPASNSSDVLVVEELIANPKNNHIHNSLKSSYFVDQPEIIPTPHITQELLKASYYAEQSEVIPTLHNTYKNEERHDMKSVEDVEMDVVPWNEAQAICTLLPFFQLNNIHQSIMDNYYHPQRKIKVLKEYVELAFEEGHELHAEVFETVSQWKLEKKRSSTSEPEDLRNGSYKRPKPLDQSSSQLYLQSLPSTSKEGRVDIPIEQPLPAPSLDSPINNGPNAVEALFNSFPEETKAWYKKKVNFLKEVNNSLSEQYILSQIIHCQTEADVSHVAARLLEEQTTDILHLDTSEINEDIQKEMENMRPVQSSELPETTDEQTGSDEALSLSSNSDESNHNPAAAADIEDTIQTHIQQLGEMFTDADPDFLSERANEVAGDDSKFVELVVELTGKRSYPKMEEYLKRQQRLDMRKKFIDGMSVEEFMEYFDDPEKVFCNTTTEMNQLYKKNAKAQLMKELPYHLSKVIDSVFRTNNYHYLPTLRELRNTKGMRKTKRTVGGPQPGDMDDVFIKELCYARMEEKIKEHHREKEKAKLFAFQKAKEEGRLMECRCCCDDEVLLEDTSTCANSNETHSFCNTCIKRYSEEQIGQGRLELQCLEGECKAPFSLSTLKRLLRPSVFSNLLKRKQAEEIAAADIDDLESCPFCNFATIMPNQGDRVFKCLNPECLKDSCRLCRELNHIPLRCEEVEKKKQTDARTFLENEMSEAMVRECHKCKRRFIKEEGCNKMICTCGAMMCYLCKKPIKGYDHFNQDSRSTTKGNSNKCPLWTNSLLLHAEEVRQRAEEAKEKLDPEVDLLHDPTKDLPQVPDYLKKSQPNAQLADQQNPYNAAAHGDRGQNHMDPRRNQPGVLAGVRNAADPIRNWMADMLLGANRPHVQRHYRPAVQRHSHQHNHHHYYCQLPNLLHPPPPAHLPPPPPAHHPQQLPPQQPRPPYVAVPPAPHFVLHHPPHPPMPTNAFAPRPVHHPQGSVSIPNAHEATRRAVQSVFVTQVNPHEGFRLNPQRFTAQNGERHNPNDQSNDTNGDLLPPNDHRHGNHGNRMNF